jgi:hypothetical protein
LTWQNADLIKKIIHHRSAESKHDYEMENVGCFACAEKVMLAVFS